MGGGGALDTKAIFKQESSSLPSHNEGVKPKEKKKKEMPIGE